MDSDIIPLENVYHILRVYLARLEIQAQLFAIVIVLGTAVLGAFFIWKLFWQPLFNFIHKTEHERANNYLRFIVSILQAITFPVLGLIGLYIARNFFETRGWLNGLLDTFTWVFGVIFAFQIVMVILYTVADPAVVRRYHYRLFIPLLLVFFLFDFLGNLTDLGAVGGIVLTTAFNSPITIGAIFVATIGLYLWTDTLQSLDELLHTMISKHTRLDPGGTKAVLTLIRYILIILGIVFALNMLQLDTATVAAITGGLAVGVGFGLREILSNFISGIYLLFERSLHPGDVIEMDGQLSVVDSLSIRSTTVRTLDNIELVIPNQNFFTSSFKTFTGSSKKVRVPIMLQTDCNINPAEVIQVLENTALNHENVLKEPAPSVFLLNYGNNVASFQLNIWLADPLLMPKTQSDLKVMLWEALKEHNIDLPFPEVELHFPPKVPVELRQLHPEGAIT